MQEFIILKPINGTNNVLSIITLRSIIIHLSLPGEYTLIGIRCLTPRSKQFQLRSGSCQHCSNTQQAHSPRLDERTLSGPSKNIHSKVRRLETAQA